MMATHVRGAAWPTPVLTILYVVDSPVRVDMTLVKVVLRCLQPPRAHLACSATIPLSHLCLRLHPHCHLNLLHHQAAIDHLSHSHRLIQPLRLAVKDVPRLIIGLNFSMTLPKGGVTSLFLRHLAVQVFLTALVCLHLVALAAALVTSVSQGLVKHVALTSVILNSLTNKTRIKSTAHRHCTQYSPVYQVEPPVDIWTVQATNAPGIMRISRHSVMPGS